MARKQVLVQLDDSLLTELDAVAEREGVSRSELIRRGVRALIQGGTEAEAVRRLVEAYRQQPQEGWVTAAGEDMAAEMTPDT
jgi:Arc/MetJ-type ribon-helix-helix transcriptional regulator